MLQNLHHQGKVIEMAIVISAGYQGFRIRKRRGYILMQPLHNNFIHFRVTSYKVAITGCKDNGYFRYMQIFNSI